MRHLIIFLSLTFLTLPSWGNDFDYNYGVDLGVNLSDISRSSPSTLSRTGGVGGIFVELFPEKIGSLIPGAYIVEKGYRDTSTKTVILNYFQFRTLGRISVHRTKSSKLYLDLGPSLDFMVRKSTDKYPSPPDMKQFRNFDLSLLAGLGFETDVSKTTRLVFNLKYLQGLMNLTPDASKSVRSSGFLITMGLQFSTRSLAIESTEERARKYIEQKHSGDPQN